MPALKTTSAEVDEHPGSLMETFRAPTDWQLQEAGRVNRIQFGLVMPADQLDKTRRTTFVHDLDRALSLISGYFDSAWIIDHLQFGNQDVLEGFTTLAYSDDDFGFLGTPQQVIEPMRPLVELGTASFMLNCKAFLRLTKLESLVRDVLPTWN